MAKIMVFVPAFGRQISTTTFESTHALMMTFMQKGIQANICSFSWPGIAEARNMMLSWWYDACPDFSHLLMVDADMGFNPQMVLDMLTFSEPMVGAIYPKKTYPIEWVGSGLAAPEYRTGFIEVEGLGMGCFLIRRDAVAAMIEKFPEMIFPYMAMPEMKFSGAHRTLGFFDEMRTQAGLVSEDISFCRRYRKTGGKIWATTNHKIEHVGAHGFSACFAEERAKVRSQMQSVKAKHGIFIYNPHDNFIGRSLEKYGEWCEFEIDLLKRFVRPGDTVIDAGANIGTHALAFAEMVGSGGKVLAFEPQPRIAALLRENVDKNAPGIVSAQQIALGIVSGVCNMADLPPDDTEFNFGGVPISAPGTQLTEVTTIDALNLNPSLIKIDVEGMEPEVILGARETIKRCQPIIYLECNRKDTKDVATVLAEIGYVAFWSIGPYFNPNNHFGNTENVWPNVMPSCNLLAVPATLEGWRHLDMDVFPYLGATDNWRDAQLRIDGQAAA